MFHYETTQKKINLLQATRNKVTGRFSAVDNTFKKQQEMENTFSS